MKMKLKNELVLASNREGDSFKLKIELHKLAHANRTFAHYRWF